MVSLLPGWKCQLQLLCQISKAAQVRHACCSKVHGEDQSCTNCNGSKCVQVQARGCVHLQSMDEPLQVAAPTLKLLHCHSRFQHFFIQTMYLPQASSPLNKHSMSVSAFCLYACPKMLRKAQSKFNTATVLCTQIVNVASEADDLLQHHFTCKDPDQSLPQHCLHISCVLSNRAGVLFSMTAVPQNGP